jgi:hypothetical protein
MSPRSSFRFSQCCGSMFVTTRNGAVSGFFWYSADVVIPARA